MKLKIENIGKIKEAEIYIDGISVITGFNDTGKSTVGRSLFALCDAFYKTGSNIHDERISNIINAITESIAKNFTFHIYYRLIESEAETILNCKDSQEVREILEQIPLKMYKKLQELRGATFLEEYSQEFEPQSKNLDNYKKEIFTKIEIALDMKNSTILTGIVSRALKAEFAGQVCCALNKKQGIFTLSDNGESVSVTVENNQEQNIVIDNMSFQTEKAVYIDNAVSIDNSNTRREIYFPLITTPRKFGHRRLLGVDLMKTPEDYNLIDNLLAQEKLSLIMKKVSLISKGALIQDRGIWHYNLTGQDKSILLNIENVSTGILAFATLRRLIENGSLQESGILILDEPETHLHPEWQNIFAEIIVLLCRDFDLKILLNTHSHYFLTAIKKFSQKYELDGRCKYYLSCNDDNSMVIFRDVTGNLDEIYKKFLRPIQDIEDLDADD